nr:MAG TPA_asm: hypothetical protein [Bacteriophage sp.]
MASKCNCCLEIILCKIGASLNTLYVFYPI